MVSVSKSRRKKKNAGEKPKLRRRTNSNRQQAIVRVMTVVTVVSALLIVLTAGKMITRKDSMVAVVPNSGGQTTSTTSALPNNHQQIASSRSSSSAHKNNNVNVNGQHYSVVIVGAGIAGLTAAKTLETKNNDRILDTDDLVLLPGGVLILEATSQWGGRIRSSTKRSITNQRSKSDESHYYYPVDMGASFTTDPKWLPVILSKSGGGDDDNGGNTNKTKNGKIINNAWDFTTTPVSEDWMNNISTSTTTAHDMMRNYSWYEFVQDFLLPSRRSGGDASSTESTTSSTSSSSTSSTSTTKIEYNCIVDKIVAMKAASLEEEVERKNGNKKSIMQVSCGSMSVTADAVLVTIPLPLLQEPLDQQEKQREAMERATDDADDDNDKIDGKPPPQDDIYNDDVDGDIFRKTGLQFHPPLPSNIQKRIHKHKATMLPALKIVFEFKHKFYPDYIDILKMPLLLAREDDDAPLIGSHEPKDLGVNPQRVYEYWADSEVRYDPKVRRPKGAKHYLVGQLLGQPAQAYYNFYYGPTRQNDFYRVSEFHDDMAQHLLQEFIDYMEQVEHFDEFLVRQNYVGYQIVHWTKETFTPGILDCSAVQFYSNHDKHGSKKKKKKNFNQVGAVPHVNGQLYFAGEAFANLPGSWYHGCGQAHGAAISGKKAALQILHSLQTKKKKKKNDDNNNNNNNNNAAPEEKSDESYPSIMIPVPTENDSSTHRDLERFSILRPEDADDLKFYAKMNELWKNFPN